MARNINHRVHVLSAGSAYAGSIIGSIIAAYGLANGFLLGFAVANLAYAAFSSIVQDEMGDKERYIALGIISWIGIATGFQYWG